VAAADLGRFVVVKAPRALVVLTLLLPAGACGDGTDSARKSLTGAAGALRKAKTATINFDVELLSPLSTELSSWAGTRKVKYGEPDVSDTEFSTASVVVPILQPRPGQPVSESHDLDLREISVGPVRYQRSKKLRLDAGKSWVKSEQGQYVEYGVKMANPDLVVIDPEQYLKLVEDWSKGLAYLADTQKTETLHGVQTRVYSIECTFGSSDSCDYTKLPPLLTSTFSGTGNTLNMKLWLDDDDRPRKLVVDANLDAGPNAVTGQESIHELRSTMTLTDFGKPVEVTEPAADQTTTHYEVAL
jgi:hypothetical protein